MFRRSVSSSAIRSVGYDETKRILEVEFVTGKLYRYASVPSSVYEELLRSSSKGDYFNSHIKEHYRMLSERHGF
jgi:hypothetical protein